MSIFTLPTKGLRDEIAEKIWAVDHLTTMELYQKLLLSDGIKN